MNNNLINRDDFIGIVTVARTVQVYWLSNATPQNMSYANYCTVRVIDDRRNACQYHMTTVFDRRRLYSVYM